MPTISIPIILILRMLDAYDIYTYYIGKDIKINKPLNSPLREDKNPSWSLFKSRNGDLMYKDFATGESGNVITLVRNLFNLTYKKAMEKIWSDMITCEKMKNGFVRSAPERVYKSKTTISIKRKYFTRRDDQYWGSYGLDRDTLKQFNVYPISEFWINDMPQSFYYTDDNPMYAYKMFDKFKIYRPLSKYKKDKWRNNCGSYDLQGLEQLPDKGGLLIITKSLKDVMVLYKYGYTSVAPQSENSTIPKAVMDNLKSRFDDIIIFFDYDEGGIRGAESLRKKFDLDKTFIPKHYLDIYGIKDISDFAKEMSEDKTIELLKELFNGKEN